MPSRSHTSIQRSKDAESMSPDTDTFVAKCLGGDCVSEEIDSYVDRWHDGDSEQSLAAFLGFTPEEYAVWVEIPQSLEWILEARRTGTPIAEVLSDHRRE